MPPANFISHSEREKRAIIFDLDGTLIDSAPEIAFSTNILLKNLGYAPIKLNIIKSFIGNGIPKFIQRIMRHRNIEYSPQNYARLCKNFKQIYRENLTKKSRPYPNVRETLFSLYEKNYKLGICTNKANDLTQQILDKLDIAKYFSAIIGGDSLPVNKPSPQPLLTIIEKLNCNKAIFVGDSEIDAETAINAKIPFILFTKGYLKKPLNEIYFNEKFDNFSSLEKKLEIIF